MRSREKRNDRVLRVLSIILIAMLILPMLPLTAFATPSGGLHDGSTNAGDSQASNAYGATEVTSGQFNTYTYDAYKAELGLVINQSIQLDSSNYSNKIGSIAKQLALLDWGTYNGFYEDGDRVVTGGQATRPGHFYSYFGVPPYKDATLNDSYAKTVKASWENLKNAMSDINAKSYVANVSPYSGLLSTATNAVTGLTLPDNVGQYLGNNYYREAMRVLAQYAEARVLTAVAYELTKSDSVIASAFQLDSYRNQLTNPTSIEELRTAVDSALATYVPTTSTTPTPTPTPGTEEGDDPTPEETPTSGEATFDANMLDMLLSDQGSGGINSELRAALFMYNAIDTAATTYYNNAFTDFTQPVDAAGQVNDSSKLFKGLRIGREEKTYAQGISEFVKAFHSRVIDPQAPVNQETNLPDEAIDVTNGALALLSNAMHSSGRIILPSGTPELTKIGYVALASGVVYDPFVSIAGNEAYFELVRSFIQEDDKKDEVTSAIQQALNIKKPLYVVEGGKTTWATVDELQPIAMGQFQVARLSHLMTIEEDTVRAYVMIKGGMSPSQVDASTWDYTHYDQNSNGGSNNVNISNNNDAGAAVSQSGGSDAEDGRITSGTTEVTLSSAQSTTPVMVTAGRSASSFNNTGYASTVGGLTSLLIHNALQDVKGNQHVQNAESELIFVNGLGDVVLSDGTVILPAIANPLLYEYDDGYTGESDEDYIEFFGNEEADAKGYYPYTVAFGNHYPEARIGADRHLDLAEGNGFGKYIIMVDGGRLYAKKIIEMQGGFWDSFTGVTQTGGVTISNVIGKSLSITSDTELNQSGFFAGIGDAGTQVRNWGWSALTRIPIVGFFVSDDTDGTDGWAVAERKNSVFITRGTMSQAAGMSMIPLQPPEPGMLDNYLEIAQPLVTSAIRYISNTGEVSGTYQSSGKFRVELYITDVIGEALLGTQYAETLVKNYQVSYEDMVADSGNRFLRFLTNIADSAASNLGVIDGVLAIKGPYSNRFFNIIVGFIQEFYLVIVVVLMILVAARFMKGHYNMLYVCFLAAMCFFGFEVYANWLPSFLPSVYNFAVNDIIEDVVWNTVLYKAECYEETYKKTTQVDTMSGALKPYTATITLYRLSDAEMGIVASREGISLTEVKKGTAIYLDYDAGIFVQGNEIKMSLDSLFQNSSMRGLYESQWSLLEEGITTDLDFIDGMTEAVRNSNHNPYSLQLTNPHVSLESYYTPYDHIERAFLMQLNTLSAIFRMERTAYNYGDGELYKDAFLVRSFLNSGIFTAPGDDEILKNNITESSVQVEGSIFATEDDLLAAVHEAFDPQEDWLNLRSIFAKPDRGIQDSLWGKIFQLRGYYDDFWNLTEKGDAYVSDMIVYINTQTKVWAMNNTDNLAFCSDENAVKMIALYATTCFTHYTSEIGSWMYPNYINASDIALKDVLYGSMTTLKDRNFAYDGTAVNTVALNVGVFGVIFLLIIILVSTVFVFVITYLVPVLYALFGGIIIFRMINDQDSMGLIKGYIKVTGVSAFLYVIFSCSLQLVRIGGYNWYGYLGCALLMMLCLYFLFWVVLSVVQDVGELGNNTLANNLLRGLNGITRGAVQNVRAGSVNVYQGARQHVQQWNSARQYGRYSNVDDYDRPYASRGQYGYGGYSSYASASRVGGSTGGYGREEYYDDRGAPRARRSQGQVFRPRDGWTAGPRAQRTASSGPRPRGGSGGTGSSSFDSGWKTVGR